MVLKLMRLLAVVGIALMVALSAPVTAHEKHNENKQAAEQQNQAAPGDMHQNMAAMPGMGEGGHGAMEEERPTTFSGRLYRFLGAMHPFAVHFPIALIPGSFIALVLARRRGHAVDVIRAVIILAGIAAVGAALLGWFNAGFVLVDEDPIQTWHRWIGTALALIVGGIGVWAWRHTVSVNSRAMTWMLGATTLLLLLQGWLGASITHGMDHMMF
jgi:uncharacterized membrane protein